MEKLLKLRKSIDENILTFLVSFYIFFIPLFPKIPFKTINYTYVSIRLEDIFIAIIALIFAIQLKRKKVTLNKQFLIPFVIFWIAVFCSLFSGIFITKNIVYRQVAFFNALRRVEYMMMFFIVAGSIKKVTHFTTYLFALFSSTFLVMVYGLGQRMAEFPSISTMNPEFAKGRIIFLTPEARLASTFAGHYDLAAYLVFLFPILWGFYFVFHKKILGFLDRIVVKTKIVTSVISNIIEKTMSTVLKTVRAPFAGSHKYSDVLLNILPNNATSLLIFITGILTILFLSNSVGNYERVVGATMAASLILFILIYRRFGDIALLLVIGTSLFVLVQTASRSSIFAYLVSTGIFLLFIKKYRYLAIVLVISIFLSYNNKNFSERFNKTFQVRQFLVNEKTGEIFVLQKMRSDVLPAGSRVLVKYKKNSKSTQDERDVRQDILNKAQLEALKKDPNSAGTSSADFKQIEGIAPDISFDTRLRVEWPRAINAFKQNPLLGLGPSAITESTDNDFLRWLGEFGLFGTISFLYILAMVSKLVHAMAKNADPQLKPLFYGYLFGLFGLLINALYIDVFEASKVAYTFWTVSGCFAGLYLLKSKINA